MRLLQMMVSFPLLSGLTTCEAPIAPEVGSLPSASEDAAALVPGPYGLEERVCFALAERCDEACSGERFETLSSLDGRLRASQLDALDRCFVPSTCGDFRSCIDAWLHITR